MFTLLFLLALLSSVTVRLWLAQRQLRYVGKHRDHVPAQFSEKISLVDHQRAADYTAARTRFGMLELLLETTVLVVLTMMGGLHWLNQTLLSSLDHGITYGICLILSLTVLTSLIELPFNIYKQFHIEKQFGFNRMTIKLFFVDLLRNALLGAVIGIPLIALVLWVMASTGENWWAWTWLLWVAFSLLMMVLAPTLIMPLYNRFVPLSDASLRERIEALLSRCGFASKGVFVMDGSKRSSHGNAYFTGFGSAKRIVFFDILLEKLTADEIEAVLAHELGHFHHRHIMQRLGVTFLASFCLLALLGWLAQQVWFYTSLGVTPNLDADNHALALILFSLVLPVFSFFFTPLANWSSRKHEFQADAFAAKQTQASMLISALVKLYQDNASTLTPDPLYSTFYASHPPASQRIAHLEQR
ncbi:MAG: M48 family metallopeptidase [Ottowia sp.]|nr:M48 family metallopeptidase [Ottowia sp.]